MRPDLPEALLNVHIWDQMSRIVCEELVRMVAAYLPPSLQFAGMTIHQVGSQKRFIGRFELQATPPQDPSFFALIPGATVTLGYDRTQRPVPADEFVREWQEQHLEQYGDEVTIDGSLLRDILPTNYDAFYSSLESKLLTFRTVTLHPFLLEVAAVNASLFLKSTALNERKGEKQGPFRYTPFGTISHQQVAAYVKQQGFRLPTSDEWEYACLAGTRTIFYWGNGYMEGEEHDVEMPPPGQHPFGLSIADDENRWECIDDPTIMRGGDGGSATCSGTGVLAESLVLASAYYFQLDPEWIEQGQDSVYFRRVYDLV